MKEINLCVSRVLSAVVSWINRNLTHNRDVVGDYGIRVIIHIPIGILMSVPVFGWGLIPLFKAYQRNEDLHTEDEAWKDYAGAIAGMVIGNITWIILLIYALT